MVSKVSVETTNRFAALFEGRKDAYGVDRGGVVRAPLTNRMYGDHLKGLPTAGIGVFPLRDDNTVRFAAIDLDEPNFELAVELCEYIPGDHAFIERSRSGNAHIWVFFASDCPAWVARGQLRQALATVDREDVEIFPKQAELREGMVGNYINLPYYGDERKIVHVKGDAPEFEGAGGYTLEGFLFEAEQLQASVDHWTNLCRQDGIGPPALRISDGDEWGERPSVHACALYMLEHKEDNPLRRGHRHVVLFNLAKMILNAQDYDIEDALLVVESYNQAGDDPVSPNEVRTMVNNAARGRWTSTGCDDPVMAPYISPDCRIAHG